ncbi:hypothetical protein BDB00DRAFT_726406, partial [Zychaea mexicana]|uniref:uncharacterized protein n=1 Tax=Zychaea mexicana TaxID=64656 RepID=UPI0022FE7A8A
LRTHHGAVDQEALTSGSPVDVLVEVKQALLSMGIDVKKDGEYKLKGVRQRRKQQQRPSSQESSTTSSSSNSRTDKKRRMSTMYGDPVVDPGEEVRFSVELCKIKNLPGLYIVDIRRMRGNVWAYKFLYHTLLD